MNYTVIQTSGWQGASWKVAESFNSKEEAEAFAAKNGQADPRDDYYNVKIISHRKNLSDLVVEWDRTSVVRFSDGTTALW